MYVRMRYVYSNHSYSSSCDHRYVKETVSAKNVRFEESDHRRELSNRVIIFC